MGQLMGQQAASFVALRTKFPGAKDDVLTDRIGSGVDLAGRLLGFASNVHTHLRKVVAETIPHILPQPGFQRPARTAKQAFDTGRGATRIVASLPRNTLYARQGAADWRMRRACKQL